jgi:exodeoxyribonuclease V alpha subunit
VSGLPTPQPEASNREVLAGLVERVTFHNAENGFCVLRIKARGHRDLITVVGHAAVIAAGEWVTASGDWVNDRTHGQQFKSRFMRTSAPERGSLREANASNAGCLSPQPKIKGLAFG